MSPSKLTAQVTLDTCALVAALAALGAWLGGAPAAVGTLAGGGLAVVNFRWLAARASAATLAGGAPVVAWLIGAGLRFTACMAACALLLLTGWAHPVALVAGFSVLPCDVIARGLAAAREES
jgi:hypothetical protein